MVVWRWPFYAFLRHGGRYASPDRCVDGWLFCLIARHCRAVMDRPDGPRLFYCTGCMPEYSKRRVKILTRATLCGNLRLVISESNPILDILSDGWILSHRVCLWRFDLIWGVKKNWSSKNKAISSRHGWIMSVGAASSRDYGNEATYFRGWKPLPQAFSLKLMTMSLNLY